MCSGNGGNLRIQFSSSSGFGVSMMYFQVFEAYLTFRYGRITVSVDTLGYKFNMLYTKSFIAQKMH